MNGRRHIIIPDVQAKPGNDFTFLKAVGNYIAHMKPDVIVNIGDFADMPSLSSYDKGKKSFEGRRYTNDVQAAHDAMGMLLYPIKKEQRRLRNNKKQTWNPQMVLTLGNHENRINRAVEAEPMLDGVIHHTDLNYSADWDVVDFLRPVVIDGVVYCHYLTSGPMGRPIGTAQRILTLRHMSAVVGHQQGRQVATSYRADGSPITAIIAGSCYEHDEDYMGPQGNNHWRGIVVLNEVSNGSFDEMFVSLNYLKEKWL